MVGPVLGDAMSSLSLYSGVQKKQSGGCHHVDSLASALRDQLTHDLRDSDSLTTSPSSSSLDTCSSNTHTRSLDTVSSTSQRLSTAFSKTGEGSVTIFFRKITLSMKMCCYDNIETKLKLLLISQLFFLCDLFLVPSTLHLFKQDDKS